MLNEYIQAPENIPIRIEDITSLVMSAKIIAIIGGNIESTPTWIESIIFYTPLNIIIN